VLNLLPVGDYTAKGTYAAKAWKVRGRHIAVHAGLSKAAEMHRCLSCISASSADNVVYSSARTVGQLA
jgi:hypothetical protein